MEYEGIPIRPPSEADAIILQVTVGCSHGRCTFCAAYNDVRFRIKQEAEIDGDLAFAAAHCRRRHRLFLADGDVLSLSQRQLCALLRKIRRQLPWVNRISLYGNAKNIRHKSVDQLRELRDLGLSRVYMGLESGHEPTLWAIRKGVNSDAMIQACRQLRAAGLFVSVTVLLGIAGRRDSLEHAAATGRVLSAMAPNQIAVLTLMVMPGTLLHSAQEQGLFVLPSQWELLDELACLVRHIELDRVQFQANHASNYLPINARLRRDKDRILERISAAQAGTVDLVPEWQRAL